MSVTPTGSGILVQTKPDKITTPSITQKTEVQDTTETVSPTPAIQPIGQLSQEPDAENFIINEKTKAEKQPADEVSLAIEKLNSYMASMKRDLEFSFDQDAKRTVVTVRDANTQEVVRQLPSEAALKLAKVLHDTDQLSKSSIGQLLDVRT